MASFGYIPVMVDSLVRPESIADCLGIGKLHQLAFSGAGESRLVDELWQAGEVVHSLVAEQAGEVVGHALFSRIDAPMQSLALGRIAVLPKWQTRGMGSALVSVGVRFALAAEWEAVFVLGNLKYYGRFGLGADAAQGFACAFSGDQFMGLPPRDAIPRVWRLVYPSPWFALERATSLA